MTQRIIFVSTIFTAPLGMEASSALCVISEPTRIPLVTANVVLVTQQKPQPKKDRTTSTTVVSHFDVLLRQPATSKKLRINIINWFG